MWPWSTINNLKMELRQAEHANTTCRERVDAALIRETKLYRSLQEATTLLKESEERRDATERANIALEDSLRHRVNERDELRKQNDDIVEMLEDTRAKASALVDQRDDLRAQLADAMKNNHKDPKTGRFVKVTG